MRGKDTPIGETGAMSGITPAYAGKRLYLTCVLAIPEDHPRVCGEKKVSVVMDFVQLGSPPRMRGKVDFYYFYCPDRRITPAYAGKRW